MHRAMAPPREEPRAPRQNVRVSREPPAPEPAVPDEAEPAPRSAPRFDADVWRGRMERVRRSLSMLPVVVLLAGTVVAGRWGHRWLTTTPRLGARNLEVTGAGRTSREEILEAGGLAAGRNVLSLDLARSAHAIEALPWIARATVTRQLPDTVRVAVEERTPAVLVAVGGLYLAAPDGTLFKRAEPGDPIDLPVLTGLSREAFRENADGAREEVRDALALVGDLESAQLGPDARLQEVHREDTGDLAVMLGGTYVWLGRGPYRSKLTRLRVVIGELRRRGLEPSEVHLESDRHPERVSVRAHPIAAAANTPAARGT